jgi:cephalosporin hydroxylase
MKITIDTDSGTVTQVDGVKSRTCPLAGAEGFDLASRGWLRAGWDAKHVYTFTWLGRPIIQLPEDMIRLQEVIVAVRPTLIIETGIAHGGSLVYSASLLHLLGGGRVVGVDIEIRPHNRRAVEGHRLAGMISMIEGSSIDPAIVSRVRDHVRPEDRVMVLLDARHSKSHVLAELAAYSPMISIGSYIVAMDGIIGQVAGAPRTSLEWATDNPTEAAREFCVARPAFVVEQPQFAFNESLVTEPVTYWPGGYIRRVA